MGIEVNHVWSTPKGDQLIAEMARVSNPANQGNHESAPKLIAYLLEHGHVSPFEMVNACFEVLCPRDISRQIIRHKSLAVQELSQRYQSVDVIPPADLRECRMQDLKNRQNSLPCTDKATEMWWSSVLMRLESDALEVYKMALDKGIAKEVARVILPEGLTNSRLYLNGNLRSWIFYLKQRLDPSTQSEHREVAKLIYAQLVDLFPATMEAAQESIFGRSA